MTTLLRKGLLSSGIVCLLFPALTSAAPHSDATDVASTTTLESDNRQRVIDVAKTALAKQLNLDASTFKIIKSEAHTWPDSSLGCAKPGSVAAQVLTSGYIVTIATSKGMHQVHATESYATTCDHNMPLHNPRNVGVPLKNMDDVIAKARDDLATRLNVSAALIRTQTFMPVEWPDTSMQCLVEGEAVEQKATKGYRIALGYRGRTYVYHTDMIRVRACPSIEAQ